MTKMKRYFTALCLAALSAVPTLADSESGYRAADSTEAAAERLAARADTAVYHYMGEGMAATSSGHTPFWLMNNRLGLSSEAQNNGYLRGGFFKNMTRDRRFSWGFGADVVVPYNFTSKFVVQQLYGEVRYRSLQLAIGSKERYEGLVDRELSSGDLTFSLNARPVPQVYVSMPRYEWVPYTRHWVAFRGYFSMGMFTDWRWQRNYVAPEASRAEKVLYHTKGMFLRVGDPSRHPVNVEGGFEMGCEFGGTVYLYDKVDKVMKVIKMPKGFKDIVKAVIPLSGGDSDDPNQAGEISNVLGNHVGQWSLAVNFNPRGSDWKFRSYYQHYFDDHSMMFLQHAWRDMLLGVVVEFPKNPVIEKFVYEYLNTKDQSGAVYWDSKDEVKEQVSGRDNYYNHYLYPGWQHWGMGMGNPLVISPIYNNDGTLEFRHNRIKGHHFGWTGRPTDELGYKVLMSYTRSWGTYDDPTPRVLHNFTAMLETTYSPRRLAGWDFRLGLGLDGGNLLGNSVGAMLTIRKTGWLKM